LLRIRWPVGSLFATPASRPKRPGRRPAKERSDVHERPASEASLAPQSSRAGGPPRSEATYQMTCAARNELAPRRAEGPKDRDPFSRSTTDVPPRSRGPAGERCCNGQNSARYEPPPRLETAGHPEPSKRDPDPFLAKTVALGTDLAKKGSGSLFANYRRRPARSSRAGGPPRSEATCQMTCAARNELAPRRAEGPKAPLRAPAPRSRPSGSPRRTSRPRRRARPSAGTGFGANPAS
jgi:hypothetical protein